MALEGLANKDKAVATMPMMDILFKDFPPVLDLHHSVTIVLRLADFEQALVENSSMHDGIAHLQSSVLVSCGMQRFLRVFPLMSFKAQAWNLPSQGVVDQGLIPHAAMGCSFAVCPRYFNG